MDEKQFESQYEMHIEWARTAFMNTGRDFQKYHAEMKLWNVMGCKYSSLLPNPILCQAMREDSSALQHSII